MKGAGIASRRGVATLAGALVIATLAGCGAAGGPSAGSASATPTRSSPTALPVVTGGGIRALWQGAPWSDLTISGAMVFGVAQTGRAAQVNAVSALTGAPAWTMTLPASLPRVLGLVPAANIVVVEAGHDFGQAPALVSPIVTEYIAVDRATGHEMWTLPVGGHYQSPPIAAAGNLLLIGDPSGAVTARVAATGQVAWRDPRPAACRAAPSGGAANAGLGVAADGSLAVASFDCGPVVIVQRLDAATGKPLWSWTSPPAAVDGMYLSVSAAAQDGGLVMLTGQIGPVPAAAEFTARLPRPYRWPSQLGPPDQVSIVLALDAADGQPRWSELGGQQETFALADGAACELVGVGLECRDDTTGAATLPDLLTGQNPDAAPVHAGDTYAGISGGVAIATVAPFQPGAVTLRIVMIRGGATAAQARLAIGLNGYGGAHLSVLAAAAGPLPDGATLVLIRRVDLPGYPVLALHVPPRPWPRHSRNRWPRIGASHLAGLATTGLAGYSAGVSIGTLCGAVAAADTGLMSVSGGRRSSLRDRAFGVAGAAVAAGVLASCGAAASGAGPGPAGARRPGRAPGPARRRRGRRDRSWSAAICRRGGAAGRRRVGGRHHHHDRPDDDALERQHVDRAGAHPQPGPAGQPARRIPGGDRAVGQRRLGVGITAGEPLAEHWDGRAWTVVPTPPPGGPQDQGFGASLQGVAAVSAQDVWAVGGTNSGQTWIIHWDGTA